MNYSPLPCTFPVFGYVTCDGRAKQFGGSRWELVMWGASGMGRDYAGGGVKSEWEVACPGGRQEEGHGLGLR